MSTTTTTQVSTSVLIKTTTRGKYWYKNTWNKLVENILQFELLK
jgi:hypothetical protein